MKKKAHIERATELLPKSYPQWYWIKGLHDAHIIGKKTLNVGTGMCEKYQYRNGLEIQLDTRLAMFDTSITALRFFNYKEVGDDVNFLDAWWKHDILSSDNGKYTLMVDVLSSGRQLEYTIRFEVCEVVRK